MTRAVIYSAAALSLAISGAAVAQNAATAAPDRASSRVVVALIGGRALGDVSKGTERGPDQRGVAASGGIALRYERRLDPWLSLAVTGDYSSWISGAAVDAGYLRQRLDVGLAPRFSLVALPNLGIFKSELYLVTPVGVTRPFVRPPQRRAFSEQVDGQLGWYAGCAVGGALIHEHWGVLVEVGYYRHASDTRSTITPVDPASPRVVEENHAVDHQLLFTFGGLFAF